jgi:glycosyltransferase involved in cell wall biosynthesis
MTTKLLYFASDYKIGLSNSLFCHVQSLNKIFKHDLICIAGENEQFDKLFIKYTTNNIKLIRVNGLDAHSNFIKLTNEVVNIINVNKINLVHVHNNWQLAIISYIKFVKRKNIKIAYTIHGYRHNSNFKSFIAKRIIGFSLFLFADIVFAATSQVKKAIPFISKKTYISYLGVDEELYNISKSKKYTDNLRISVVGEFRLGKNQKLIINSLNEYAEKSNDFNFTLNFAGTGHLFHIIKKFASTKRISGNIKFLGHLNRDNIKKLYQNTDIVIIASNFETFGFCIAEPFVAGIPIITRNTGIAQDIIKHGVNGLVYEKDKELTPLLLKYLRSHNRLIQLANNLPELKKDLFWDNININYVKYMLGLNNPKSI